MRDALDLLGFGPCYHMTAVFEHPEHAEAWTAAAAGRPVLWDALFKYYQSITDAPGCMFWRELAAHYPQAKVILSLRDPEKWFASTQATVLSKTLQGFDDWPPAINEMLHAIEFHPDDATAHDRAHMIARFKAHNAAVREAIPPDRLLVYEAALGWEPLCAFLGVTVPNAPYPHVNTTVDFLKEVGAA